jgi:phosphoribosylanthranilate isomerase
LFGKIILAGGLNPENVKEAITIVKPYGVDVSSGVEDFPGKKNHDKVKLFIKNAKSVKI